MGKRKSGRRARLLEAINGLCGICGEPNSDGYSTIEHVIPRKIPRRHRRRIATIQQRFDFHNVIVSAHETCNVKKGNRVPTGCELIFLILTNARLHEEAPASHARRNG